MKNRFEGFVSAEDCTTCVASGVRVGEIFYHEDNPVAYMRVAHTQFSHDGITGVSLETGEFATFASTQSVKRVDVMVQIRGASIYDLNKFLRDEDSRTLEKSIEILREGGWGNAKRETFIKVLSDVVNRFNEMKATIRGAKKLFKGL